MEGLADCFEDLADPRTGNARRHDLVEIMAIALALCFAAGKMRGTWCCSDGRKKSFVGNS